MKCGRQSQGARQDLINIRGWGPGAQERVNCTTVNILWGLAGLKQSQMPALPSLPILSVLDAWAISSEPQFIHLPNGPYISKSYSVLSGTVLALCVTGLL